MTSLWNCPINWPFSHYRRIIRIVKANLCEHFCAINPYSSLPEKGNKIKPLNVAFLRSMHSQDVTR